jgi:8-amino-7-oxononanoate synthase
MTPFLKQRLQKRKDTGNLRTLRIGPDLIDFASNDYLGLARSSRLLASVIEEQKVRPELLNGLGSTGSRLLTGNSNYAQELENRIAAFHGYEAGLLFNCGYMANVGLISTVVGDEDHLFFDAKVHASTHDGIRLSRAQAFAFRHNDLHHLEQRLKNASSRGNRFICVESIYSTDGSEAPLQDICQLAQCYRAHVIVDEAHAVGVCGPQGRGLVAEYQIMEQVFAQVVTFGKALGVQGAIVLGDTILKESLVNFATSYIYTTALPFHALAAIKCSYDLFPTLDRERHQLQALNGSKIPIQFIKIRENEPVKKMALKLRKEGFDVSALMSPTVKRGCEGLRICLHSFNTENELKTLLECVKKFL